MKTARAAGLGAALLCCTVSAHADDLKKQVDGWRAAHETQILTQFDTLLRFPSVAAQPQGTAAAGAWLQNELKARGFRT